MRTPSFAALAAAAALFAVLALATAPAPLAALDAGAEAGQLGVRSW